MKLLVLIIFSGLVLSGCQPRPTSPHDPPQIPGSNGTMDSGGGNGTTEGRPLDSYLVPNFESLPEVQQVVVPILNTLRSTDPIFSGKLLHILRHRSWYILPAKLDEIPSHVVGVYFPTTQIVHHRLSEIWIDENLWNKMGAADRQVMVMHELILGAMFLKYQNRMDQCLASGRYLELPIRIDASEPIAEAKPAAAGEEKKYSDWRSSCIDRYRLDFLKPEAGSTTPRLHVSGSEYSSIRKLSSQLVKFSGHIHVDELRMLLISLRIESSTTNK